MADQVQANGPSSEKFIDSFNPDDPEYIREQQRPATIREDVREMERRKRVSLVLNSQAFREELEEIISSQLRQGPHPASLIALQQISELLPQGRLQQSFGSTAGGGGGGGGMGRGGMCNSILPISDIKPAEAARYMGGEKHLRCKLASLYRLVDMHGWSGLHTHITARVSQEQEHLLMNPYGYLYNEVTAASLVKVNLQGDMVDPGSTILGVNRDEFTLHQAVHSARPSIRCIVHLNTPAASAISAMKCGLQLLCIEAIMCGKVSYHEYRGAPVILDEADEIRHSLGPFSKLIFLRNHGFLALGETIEEAWFYARNAALACETQLNCLSYGGQELWQPSEETIEKLHDAAKSALVSEVVREGDREIRWGVGQREFEALMRWMDNAGYRTGYVYKQPIVKVERFNKRFEDVEVPPSATSVQEMLDDDAAGSPRAHKAMDVKKKQEKTKWLNAPASSTTTTQKVEVDETGKTVTTTTTTSSSSKVPLSSGQQQN